MNHPRFMVQLYWINCKGWEPAGLWLRIAREHYRLVPWPCRRQEGLK